MNSMDESIINLITSGEQIPERCKAGFDKVNFTVRVEGAPVDIGNLSKQVINPFKKRHELKVWVTALQWGDNVPQKSKHGITTFEVCIHKPKSLAQILELVGLLGEHNQPKTSCHFEAFTYVELYLDVYLKEPKDYQEGHHKAILASKLDAHIGTRKNPHATGEEFIYKTNSRPRQLDHTRPTNLTEEFLSGHNYRMGHKPGDPKARELYTHAYLKTQKNRSQIQLERGEFRARFEMGFSGSAIDFLNLGGLKAEATAKHFYIHNSAKNKRIEKALQNLSGSFNKSDKKT